MIDICFIWYIINIKVLSILRFLFLYFIFKYLYVVFIFNLLYRGKKNFIVKGIVINIFNCVNYKI